MLGRPLVSTTSVCVNSSKTFSTFHSNLASGKLQPDLKQFVPVSPEPTDEQIGDLTDFVDSCRIPAGKGGLLVVTGAGISTESGLPDYRSEGVGLYAKKDHKVTQHQTFVKSEKARKSYWVRNFVGWGRWSAVQPNTAHRTLALWERLGVVSHLITQNVDQLHYKAGSANVIEIHGTNSIVACLDCNYSIHRHPFQEKLIELNPSLAQRPPEEAIRPDGDVAVSPEDVDNFVMCPCPKCGGPRLKPKIVFFGDNVPRDKVEKCKQLVSECSGILAIGTSLQTFSGYRLFLQAKDQGKQIGILNIGDTRADHLAHLKIKVQAGKILPRINVSNIAR